MIKIYTDTTFITPEYRKIIFPLLFDLCYINTTSLLKIYKIVNNIEEADIVIVPIDIAWFFKNKKQQWLYDCIDKGNTANKKVWVYTAGDYGITLKYDVYTFRLGGFSSKLDYKTFILPSFINDPYDEIPFKFKWIEKSILPKIGFVGNADGSRIKWSKEFVLYIILNVKRILKQVFADYQPFYPSGIKRYYFLKKLQNNNQIKTNFILRKQYRAGAKSEEDIKRTTLEFFENIYEVPYTFCLRGYGNFSVRFYETLAMGRIPIVIDTDVRLPLDDIIIWDKHCIIASENNFAEKLIHFHQNIKDNDFQQIQINNRNLWLNFLERESYFIKIHSFFKLKE